MNIDCHACGLSVPAGVFCGNCGAYLNPQPGDGPKWLRPKAFCAAPDQHILRPSVASSLFPHLSQFPGPALNLGLVLVLLAMALAVALRLPGALITIATLGLPLLLLIYRQQSGIYRDIPRGVLMITALLGIAIGVGWVMLAGNLIFRETGDAFDAGIAGDRVLREGLGVAQSGVVLMMVPALVMRLLRPSARGSLNGYIIGGVGALSFTAAATFTRLAPQFAAGPVAKGESIPNLFIEAGIRGVTIPLTAACAGGLIGLALWFTRPSQHSRLSRRVWIAVLTTFSVVTLAVYGIVGLVDSAGIPHYLMLLAHIAMAVVALVTLRIGLQLALLYEYHDPPTGEPLLCLHCRNVVPEMPFCPACGAANCASSQASRAERRDARPAIPTTQEALPVGDRPTLWPGYALPAEAYSCAPLSRFSSLRLLGIWSAAIVAVSAPLIGVSALISNPTARYNCPPDCGRPPFGTPVATNPRFTAASGEFSVSYPAPGAAYETKFDDNGVTARFTGGVGGTLRMSGKPAAGKTAKEIVASFLDLNFPNARTAYEVPNAMVGYEPGYGEVADLWPQDGDASYRHLRVIVLAAVKNDVGLIIAAVGPYRKFGPDSGPGKPSGANLQIAEDMGKYINSFRWRGDPPR